MKTVSLLILACLFTLILFPPQAAHSYSYSVCLDEVLRWKSNPPRIRASAVSFPGGSSYRSSLGSLMSHLNNNPSNFDFNLTYDEPGVGRGNGENEIWFSSDPNALDGAPAITWYWYDCVDYWIFGTDVELKETDVVFDVNVTWTSGNTKSVINSYGGMARPFRTTALHELGHATGLGHVNSIYNIMGQDWTHIHANGDTATGYYGEDASNGDVFIYGTSSTSKEDVAVVQWRRTGASGEYSTHSRTRVFNSGGTELSKAGGYAEPRYMVNNGQSIQAEYSFENNGTHFQGNIGFGVYLSSNDLITTLDRRIGGGTLNLARDTVATIKLNVNLPNDLSPNTNYHLGVIIDENDAINEIWEGNNATYIGLRTTNFALPTATPTRTPTPTRPIIVFPTFIFRPTFIIIPTLTLLTPTPTTTPTRTPTASPTRRIVTVGDFCVEPSGYYTGPAANLPRVKLGPVTIDQAILPTGGPVPLSITDCSKDGKLDVSIPWSQTGAIPPATIRFATEVCDGRAPQYVEIVLSHGTPITLNGFDDSGALVASVTDPSSDFSNVVVLVLSSPNGIRYIEIDGAEICLQRICWTCGTQLKPTPTFQISRPTRTPTPTPDQQRPTVTPTPTKRIAVQATPTVQGLIPTPTPRFRYVNYDDLIIGQGFGGSTLVNIRNLDPRDGSLTSILRSFSGAAGIFLERIGGGSGRETHLSTGDLNNDGYPEVVLSFGPIVQDATFPSIVIPRTANTREVLGGSFLAFPIGSGSPVNYNQGDIRTAVGNFIGSATPQIAVAQGYGGNGIVRLFQYTGRPAPNSWAVVGQFTALPENLILQGDIRIGVNLAAGDLDGDGLDELIASQTNGPMSQTIFHVLDIGPRGNIVARHAHIAFAQRFRGNGGVELEVTDLNGDGKNELVAVSMGNTRDFGDARDTVPLNLATVIIPQIRLRQVIGFQLAGGIGVFNVFRDVINPSGAITVAAGEFSGNWNDGDELVFGTGAYYDIVDNQIVVVKPAPESRYKFMKVELEGTTVKSVKTLFGPGDGYPAFAGAFKPISGAILLDVIPWLNIPLDLPTPTPVHPDPIWVDDDNTSGVEDGSSEHPYNTIGEAMIHAVTHTIQVRSGTYNETVILANGVKLLGAGADSTFIDAGGSGTLVTASSTAVGTILSGFTLRNGSLGILCQSSVLTISENRITQMDPTSISADGIRLQSSSPIIRNNAIHSVGGMGIRGEGNSEPSIINNTIYDYGYYAGISFAALNIGAVHPVIKNNIVMRGNSSPVGGILWASPAAPDVSYNDVYDVANVTGGGALYSHHDGTSWVEQSGGAGAISANPRFIDEAHGYFLLDPTSPCIDAGDPNPIYNDIDGTRNDMGAFGGQRLLDGDVSHAGSGFAFTSVGKIPVSEITQDSSLPTNGLANVSAAAASDYYLPMYQDAPFGGSLWLRGLFGVSDDVDYYQIIATSEDGSESYPLGDLLTKVRYTVDSDGLVSYTSVRMGPQTLGGVPNLYLLNKEGYWSHQDLRMVWNTTGLNGRWTLTYKAYQLTGSDTITEVTLPATPQDHLTLWLDNASLDVKINDVFYSDGSSLEECQDIVFPHEGSTELMFNITANHPAGFLRYYVLDAYWGHNHYGGQFVYDQYNGSHDSVPPTWLGVQNDTTAPLLPVDSLGNPLPWQDCAYRFRLYAEARTTNGFQYIRGAIDNVYHSVDTESPSTKVAARPLCLDCLEESSVSVTQVSPLNPIPAPVLAAAKTVNNAAQRGSVPAQFVASASDYVDTWYNIDSETGGMTRLIVSGDGANLTLHGYGRCHPSDCDWGETTASPSGTSYSAVYEFGFKTDYLTLTLLDEDLLQVYSVNIFHDGTDRDYEATYYLHRSVIWVDDDNTSGTENGTKAHPYNTIGEGIDDAVAGQNVRVRPGLYTESVNMKDKVNLFGSGAESIIDATGYPRGVTCSEIGEETVLSGFRVQNVDLGIYCIASNLTIREMMITQINPDSTTGDGIRLDSASPIIRNNVIAHVGGIGIRAQGSSQPRIINNTIYDYHYYAGISFAALDIGSVTPVIKNNIIVRANDESVGGILWSLPALPEISYNDVYDVADVTGGGAAYAYHNGTSWIETDGGLGAIMEDPMFLDAAHDYFYLDPLSPAVDAGDPDALYNDSDGSRNDMGAFGWIRLNITESAHEQSGFVFTSIGNVPIPMLVSDPADPSFGLLRVSNEDAADFHIPTYWDSPMGGQLWLNGLFGENDDVDYYQVIVTPFGTTDSTALSDPLVKTEYIFNSDGTTTANRVQLGPQTVGGVSNLYQLNKEGYWTFTDLRCIWNTTGLNGKYTVTVKSYRLTGSSLAEVSLPANTLDHFTVELNNHPVQALIDGITYADGTPLEECEKILLPHNGDSGLVFTITAWHPDGYLRSYSLSSYWGNNRFGGYFARDQYAGAHDSTPPFWSGVMSHTLPPQLPQAADGSAMDWHTCPYHFYLEATSRVTDGVTYLHWSSDSIYQSISVAAP